jgi:hypothetical protein
MKIYKKNNFVLRVPVETVSVSLINLIENCSFQLLSDEISDFTEYQTICSVRNPYDRVLTLFMNLEVLPRIAVTKEKKNAIRKYFLEWVNLCFDKKKLVVDLNDYGKNSKIVEYLKQTFFNDGIPNFFIRYEDMLSDIEELKDVFEESEVEGFKLETKEEVKFNFKEFYDIQSAKLVYEYFFSQFHLIGYDPFSFTYEELSEDTKIKFIHDTF